MQLAWLTVYAGTSFDQADVRRLSFSWASMSGTARVQLTGGLAAQALSAHALVSISMTGAQCLSTTGQ